ncbi:hypothetical protein [Tsukamurella tyrosinosolvens]|uniref:hypothetical protein n=1 Tax=Tsukamurella tyrosinosolvens TaxID=57704 RepID=UPI002DD42146|nr:hypothetical protein [Tsukamurella tyrosinosolvens]MEC4612903.1 hypothetical protein [Tsukamurella tyrosinosolvens]
MEGDMQPNGEHNQQGPAGPPNFPPPGGGYAKHGIFSGPDRTRNFIFAGLAALVLVVIVLVTAISCSGSSESTPQASEKAQKRANWSAQELISVVSPIDSCWEKTPNATQDTSAFNVFIFCNGVRMGIYPTPGRPPISEVIPVLKRTEPGEAERRCYLTDGYRFVVAAGDYDDTLSERKTRLENAIPSLKKIGIDDVTLKCDSGLPDGA